MVGYSTKLGPLDFRLMSLFSFLSFSLLLSSDKWTRFYTTLCNQISWYNIAVVCDNSWLWLYPFNKSVTSMTCRSVALNPSILSLISTSKSNWFLGIVITVKPNRASYLHQLQTNEVFGCFALHLECIAFILHFFDQIYLTLLITPIYIFTHFIIKSFILLQS